MTCAPASPSTRAAARQGDAGRQAWFIVVGLVALITCAFAGVVRCDYIDLDDHGHVLENPLVQGGLSVPAMMQAFTTPHASLWVPLTWLSWMVEVSLFGLNPGEMHAANLGLHAGAAVLLFLTLRRMTGQSWPSATVALLFGLHPLNVESVAWVAERKNVLCAFFWMLTLLAYTRYAERPGAARYALTLAAFALALLAKPMAVTLPCVLLLIDFWPLARHRHAAWRQLAWEKLPFFLFSCGAATMQIHAVALRGQSVSLDFLPLPVRVSNALISYAAYLRDLAWPVHLGVFYPHPGQVQLAGALLAAALLASLSMLVWQQRLRRPYLLMGWCWFLGTLVPMIGLVQAGSQARADRFTYLAALGIFIPLAWWLHSLHPPRWALLSGGCAAAAALAGATAAQVSHWTDSTTLFEHSLRVTGDNPRLEALAANARVAQQDFAHALPHYDRAVRLFPDMAETWNDYGAALTHVRDDGHAARCFAEALRREPGRTTTRYNLATTFERLGETPLAIAQYQKVLAAAPDFGRAELRLGRLLAAAGQSIEARPHLQAAVRLLPQDAEATGALAALTATGR